MALEHISENVAAILAGLPAGVSLVAAGKTRTADELRAAIAGGVTAIGHNYVQEAEAAIAALGRPVAWHFIGHLQRNKAKKAVELFDLIETVDSLKLAQALDRAAGEAGRRLPVLIEVNSGQEPNKAGAMPAHVPDLVAQVAALEHLQVQGLMTMGPWLDDPEEMRPYFHLTRKVFDQLREAPPPGVEMRHLSMGMSDSYRVAIDEGATLVRIGTALFGPRGG